ncbi:MAG: hypothetical protein ACXAEF_00860 [Candidatus Thorarchaeota archaeon]
MKVIEYGSKNELYRDYKIAVKFVLEKDADHLSYPKLHEGIQEELQEQDMLCKMEKQQEWAKNYDRDQPTGQCYYYEYTKYDDEGNPIGTRIAVVDHESGPEVFFFISLLAGGAGIVIGNIAKEYAEQLARKAFGKIHKFFVRKWHEIMGVKIVRVEVRTEDKGVMSLPFSEFDIDQISCLVKKWKEIKHISEANEDCFNKKLTEPVTIHRDWVDPNGKHPFEPLAND